jgi:chromosome segregation ATPase
MRPRSPAIVIPGLLWLAGCATSPDPAKGGFISGVNGLLSGGYDRRIAEQSSDLDRMRAQQAAAEADAGQANALLARRQQSVAAMRVSVANMDRSVRSMQTRLTQERSVNSALSAHDVQLARELNDAEGRLARLHNQLGSADTPADYDAAQREYQSLQAAIAAMHEQLEGVRQ